MKMIESQGIQVGLQYFADSLGQAALLYLLGTTGKLINDRSEGCSGSLWLDNFRRDR
jgi:hypothetical protein